MIARPLFTRYMFIIAGLFSIITGTATATEMRLETSLKNGGNAVILFADNPLKTMTETAFAVNLNNNEGQPIEDASLEVSLTMPFMPMPPNHPEITWSEDAYRGTAIFTMAGAWQVNVDIRRLNSTTEKIIFDIEMVIMK